MLISGTNGNDSLVGGQGRDTLDGGEGADTLVGGAGRDLYLVDNALDVIDEQQFGGKDRVRASVSWVLGAYLEDLVLVGNAPLNATGNDRDNLLVGNAADNVLEGGAGRDRLRAGLGNDVLVYDPDDRKIDGGAGEDTLRVVADSALLNLRTAHALSSIEHIELVGLGLTVSLTVPAVRRLNETKTLRIDGDASASVVAPGHWVSLGTADGYARYALSGVVLEIAVAVDRSAINADQPALPNQAPLLRAGAGSVALPFSAGTECGMSLDVDPAGRLVIGISIEATTGFDFAVARLTADGAFDAEFGLDGLRVIPVNSSTSGSGLSDLALMPDGDILGVGYRNEPTTRLVAFRLDTQGAPDAAFGSNGVALTLGTGLGNDWFTRVLPLPDASGAALATGYSANGNSSATVLKLDANGQLDSSFGANGVLAVSYDPQYNHYSYAFDLAAQPDGKFVVVGYTGYGGGYSFGNYVPGSIDAGILRINSNGSIDTTFNGSGVRRFSFGGGDDVARYVLVQPDGKIVVGGYASVGNITQFALARFNVDGSFDPNFDGDGRVIVPVGSGSAFPQSLVRQADGKILMAGFVEGTGYYDSVVIRLDAGGALDPTFGVGGKVVLSLGSGSDGLQGMRVLADGKIALVGFTQQAGATGYDTLLARLNRDGSLDNSFHGPLFNRLACSEGGAAQVVNAEAWASDPELAQVGFGGASLSLARQGGPSPDDVFGASGALGPLVEGASFSFNGHVLGTVTQNSAGQLMLTFNSTTTEALLIDTLRAVTYRNSGDAPPAVLVLDWTFSDGNEGGRGSGGAGISTGKTLVSMTAVNDAPVVRVGDGTLLLPVPNGTVVGEAHAVDAEGRAVLVGGAQFTDTTVALTLTRVLQEGALDTTFGGGGFTQVPVSTGSLRDVTHLPDGRIVAVGLAPGVNTGSDFVVVELDATGQLVPTFGDGGKALIPVSAGNAFDDAWAVRALGDGRLLVAGQTQGPTSFDFVLVRLTAAGQPDLTFNGNGKVVVPDAGRWCYLRDMELEPDGKILLAGFHLPATPSTSFVAMRLNADGSLDTSFGSGGQAFVPVAGVAPAGFDGDVASTLARQPDGKILLAGYSFGGTNDDFSVIRLRTDGTLDNTFSGDGKLVLPIGTGNDRADSILVQADGRIVLAGVSNQNGTDMAVVVRLNADGTLDTSFDADGIRTLALNGGVPSSATQVTQLPDGRLVVSGYATVTTDGVNFFDSFFCARLNPNGSLDNAFGAADDVASVLLTSAPKSLLSSFSVADAELDSAGNYNGATLTLSRQGGSSENDFFTSGDIRLGALVSGSSLVFDGEPVGSVVGNSAGTLVLSFNGNATASVVGEVVRAIAYTNLAPQREGQFTLGLQFSDGNVGAQGVGGAAVAIAQKVISMPVANFIGTAAPETLTGGAGADVLLGLGGADSLLGGGGDDVLVGGGGNDDLAGGLGRDVYRFDIIPDGSFDSILGFEGAGSLGGDLLWLDADAFGNALASGLLPASAFEAIAAGGLTPAATLSTTRILYDTSTGALWFDADGNGVGAAPVLFALLLDDPVPALNAGDFIVGVAPQT